MGQLQLWVNKLPLSNLSILPLICLYRKIPSPSHLVDSMSMPNYAAMLAEKSKFVKTSMVKPDKDDDEPSIEAPKTTSDLTSDDWKAKFDCIKLDSDGKTPLKGEFSRVARLAPRVPKETLRRRFWQQDISKTKTGPSPVMGVSRTPCWTG